MSDNPLETDPSREQRIRERAYHMWEADGRPSGHDLEYWERASELVGMSESQGAGQTANPISLGVDPTAPTNVEEASIQENLGEFPDRLADQGDRKQTPSRSNRKK